MSAPGSVHVKGARRYAFAALALASITGAAFVLPADGKLFGFEVSSLALLGVLLLGVVVAIVGITRRSVAITATGAALLALALLPAGTPRPNVANYALGALFGLGLLLMVELIYMIGRHERASRVVETGNVPESHVNSVIVEARRTLFRRAALAFLAVALAVGGAFALRAFGPRQWRAAVETSAPLGVAVLALALAGAASLFILARGAKFKLRREPKPKELLPDVAE